MTEATTSSNSKRTSVITFRLASEEMQAFKKYQAARRVTASSAARELVLAGLSALIEQGEYSGDTVANG